MNPPPQHFSHWPTWPLPIAPAPESLTVSPRHTCSYLPDRLAVFRAFDAPSLPPEEFQRLMDAGFRRSGTLLYQPMCPGCRRCVPIRVPVVTFVPSKSQQRVIRRNEDLTLRVAPPQPTAEKWDLYDRYQRQWHDGKQAGDPLSFITFLYRSPVKTLEFEYRNPTGKLIGIGLCDVTPSALSSVYFYFDPAEDRRSPGTFSALREIAWAKEQQLPYWYLGYWVEGCRTMDYKSRYQPAELLGTDGVWRPFLPASAPR